MKLISLKERENKMRLVSIKIVAEFMMIKQSTLFMGSQRFYSIS